MSDLGVWEGFKNQIRHHLNTDNINRFASWPIMQQTMVAGVDRVEYDYLLKSPRWDKWNEVLPESILKPNSYEYFPRSSTNNMHHAYSLDLMMEYMGDELENYGTIIEFGGGYGNTCRLSRCWYFTSDYYIYDIPELIEIQRHYLSMNGIVGSVHFLSGDDKVPELENNKGLFLGLWSISETPQSERAQMLENLRFFECDKIFLAMGGTFFNENNLDWLNKDIIPRLDALGYQHHLERIAHGSEMFYFMAKKG